MRVNASGGFGPRLRAAPAARHEDPLSPKRLLGERVRVRGTDCHEPHRCTRGERSLAPLFTRASHARRPGRSRSLRDEARSAEDVAIALALVDCPCTRGVFEPADGDSASV